MVFSNLELSQRLERAEGDACVQFAKARKRLFPGCSTEWRSIAGAVAVFDGVGAPTTQSFGLGLFEPLTAETLGWVERFFADRGSATMLEISPFVGVQALELLCSRGYRPFEVCNVLYREVETLSSQPEPVQSASIQVRKIGLEDAGLWSEISARGWTHEHPELRAFVRELGALCAAREQSPCFLAEVDGQPGAAGTLTLHEGVALFGGSSTVPELRRRGLQAALLETRMRYALEAGCDLAMMVAEAGSNSQRNAERKGFRVAYTRMKWRSEAV
jgi:GNAT superfamily N-acetyltransferase